jgi:hypothetical protein
MGEDRRISWSKRGSRGDCEFTCKIDIFEKQLLKSEVVFQ